MLFSVNQVQGNLKKKIVFESAIARLQQTDRALFPAHPSRPSRSITRIVQLSGIAVEFHEGQIRRTRKVLEKEVK